MKVRMMMALSITMMLVTCLSASGEVADSISYPINGSISQDFGGPRKHLGEDLTAAVNDPVYAPSNATIFDSSLHKLYGGVVIAEFTRLDGGRDVWLVGHLFASTLRGVGSVRKGEVIGKIADTANNGGWAPHAHFAIRRGPHPGNWVYPGYEPNEYGQTLANFYDPSDYIARYPTGFPPPNGDTRASLATLDKTDRGEGYWLIVPTCEDRAGKAGGVRSIWVWLHMRNHTPEVWIDLGKRFSPNNPARWSTEYIYDVFFRLEEGVYEIYVITESGDGRLTEKQYSGKNIDVNRSTKPPVRIDDRLTQNGNGTISYWLKSQAEHGRRFVRRMGLWIQAGNRMIPVPPDASGNESTWLIDPKALGLAVGRYQLFYYFEDVWGTKTDPLTASNRWFDVSAVPAELPTVTPSHWTQWSHGIAIANAIMPNYPMKDRIPLTVELGGGNIANLDHWCILVYGNNGNPNSYKAVSAHQTSRSISCTVDTYNLMDGKLTIGALFYLKGNGRDGYEVMSYGRLLVDKR